MPAAPSWVTAGLARLGRLALDGTKVRANASKHKAMSSAALAPPACYERLESREAEWAAEVDRVLAEAEAVDAEDDARYGKGARGATGRAGAAGSRRPELPEAESQLLDELSYHWHQVRKRISI